MPNEYKNEEVGTIYLQTAKDVEGKEYEVWFENFNIIGIGATRVEALQDAASYATGLVKLVSTALASETE